MKFLNLRFFLWLRIFAGLALTFILLSSCDANDSEDKNIIYLKWNKSHEQDTLEKNRTGLTWALSFLGSTIAMEEAPLGLSQTKDMIRLDVTQAGFSDRAIPHLQSLIGVIQNSEEYKLKGTIDIGRFIALTIGSSHHYYKIAQVPQRLSDLESKYTFDSITAYINNSSISKIDREIEYSINNSPHRRAFISAERDTITKEIQEFETVELMDNGLSRFALYDREGNLKTAGDPKVTRAGKPSKCMWCHESGIQQLFRAQLDFKNYVPYASFLDSLKRYNRELKVYQDSIWKNAFIKKRSLHTEMEIAYITFMEPSVEQLANEWQLSQDEVKSKLSHLKSHTHHEFGFLGNLFYRKDIDALAPFKCLEVPDSFREKSNNEDAVYYIK